MERNIYSPGAGHQPPLLVGREHEVIRWQRMLGELGYRGRVGAEDMILRGPRGVGKTVLMGRFTEVARAAGYEVLSYQPAGLGTGVVESIVEQAADKLDDQASAWTKVRRSFEKVAGVGLGAAGVSASLELSRAPAGTATTNPRAVAQALADLAAAVRSERPNGGVLLAVDELQVTAGTDLSLIAVTLHRLNTEHPEARVAFVATALPTIYSVLEEAGVTHPDRLFPAMDIPSTLPSDAAYSAIVTPAMDVGVSWEPGAADAVVTESGGYPAHLQLMAAKTWSTAQGPSLITLDEARHGIAEATEAVRAANFETLWDRLPDFQRNYVVALANHHGHASTATMVEALGKRSAQDLSEARDELIKRGVITSPRRGEVAFTAPTMTAFVLEQEAAATVLRTGRASFPSPATPRGLPAGGAGSGQAPRQLPPGPGRTPDRGPER